MPILWYGIKDEQMGPKQQAQSKRVAPRWQGFVFITDFRDTAIAGGGYKCTPEGSMQKKEKKGVKDKTEAEKIHLQLSHSQVS